MSTKTDNIKVSNSFEGFYELRNKAEKILKERTKLELINNNLNIKPEIWYRGQANHEYKLLPSLLRPPNVLSINRELELFNKYSRLSRLNPTTRIEEWTQLFKMQHQFIPTRLLDWSQSLNVALYFALKEDEHNPPCIILFSPILLYIKKVKQENEPINERNVSPKYINDLDFSYEDSIEGKKSSKYPVVNKSPLVCFFDKNCPTF